MKKLKLKTAYTAHTIFAELDQLRQTYQTARRGYRDQIYTTMQGAQKLIVRLEKNDRLRRHFIRQLKPKKGKRAETGSLRLSLEVAALAIGAKSRKARQKAWKHAEVLDHFRKIGIDVKRTARTIKAKGGIDKILKEVARKNAAAEIAGGNTFTKDHREKKTGTARESEEPDRKADNVARASNATSNNKEIQVPVWMRLSDRDEMQAEQVGTRFKLFGLRVGQKAGDLKITSVKKIKSGPIKSAERASDEWND